MKAIFASIAISFTALANGAVAQSDESSLRDKNSESAEGNAVLAIEKLVFENRRLREELDDAKKTAAAATGEVEVFRRQVTELTKRMEALGASTASPSALEQRVLQAANAMRHSEAAKTELSNTLARLARIAGDYGKNPDSEAKIVLDSELKRVDGILAKTIAGPMLDDAEKAAGPNADLHSGKVSAMKPEIGCVVINLGARHGVKVGMPFQVRRGDKIVATLRIVDARQSFAGAVIQNQISDKDPIKLGDTVKVDARM